MFVQVNSDNEITQLITIGGYPTNNTFEISDNTPKEILENIYDYYYINNEFILKEDVEKEKLKKIKEQKIKALSKTCNEIITKGIIFNEENYSLREYDQINLSKLENLAKEGNSVLYHADGKKCRVYDAEEFLELTQFAFTFINFNTTYFNLLKSQVNDCLTIDEVLAIYFGTDLTPENQRILELTGANLMFSIPIIEDNVDYNIFTKSVVDIDSLLTEMEIVKKQEVIEESSDE